MYNYILYSTPASQVLHTKVYNSLFLISEYAGKYIKTLFFTHDDGTVNHILRHFNLNTRYEQYNEQYISQRHVGFRCTTAVSIASLFLFFLFVIIFLLAYTCNFCQDCPKKNILQFYPRNSMSEILFFTIIEY